MFLFLFKNGNDQLKLYILVFFNHLKFKLRICISLVDQVYFINKK